MSTRSFEGSLLITWVAKVHRPSWKKRKFHQISEFGRMVPISGGPSARSWPVHVPKTIVARMNLDRWDSLAEREGLESSVALTHNGRLAIWLSAGREQQLSLRQSMA